MAEKLGGRIHFDVVTHSPSGGFAKNADSIPQFWVMEEDTDAPLISSSGMTLRTGRVGWYRGHFDTLSAIGFEAQKRYQVLASGMVEGINGQVIAKSFFLEANNLDVIATGNIPVNVEYWRTVRASGNNGLPRVDMVRINNLPISGVNVVDANITQLNGVAVSGVDGITLASGNFVYYADIRFHKDTGNTRDEWSAQWYRNDGPLGSGAITSPVLQVINITTGTDLIASSGMSYVSINVGTVKYYENTNRTTAGENYIAKCSATIDGQTHNWQKLVGRDS
jgi:hypothetical protein